MSLSLLDWRRQVAALYAGIRRATDAAAAHQHWQRTRERLIAEHPESPLAPGARSRFRGLDVAPYDRTYRFEAEVDGGVEPRRFEAATGTDGLVVFERVGVARLPGVGELDVWWLCAYGGGLFVPIRDGLAGTETYGGGRYVVDTAKGADLGSAGTQLVVDLNFAYNPSCAYDPRWACPLPPPGNVVDVPVPVGERLPP